MTAKTILIIDDSQTDRVILSRFVAQSLSCKTIEASGGEEALKILGKQNVDLVLLDVQMPGLTGDEMILKIREKKPAEELPIIMVSGHSQTSVIVKCLKAGANDYLEKPINFEVALTRIVNQLKLSEAVRYQVHNKELLAVNAMITTFHHEINNPLTIAKMEILKFKKQSPANPSLESVSKELDRITEVIQKIQKVKQGNQVLFEQYSGDEKMVKFSKS
jgi:DNA-binding response OmpR family regulator